MDTPPINTIGKALMCPLNKVANGYRWIARPFREAVRRAESGEEKFWFVFWVWGVLLYWGSSYIGASIFIYLSSFYDDYSLLSLSMQAFTTLGLLLCSLIMLMIYPFRLFKALLKCSRNSAIPHKIAKGLVYCAVLPFLCLHIPFYGMITFLMINNTIWVISRLIY